MAAASLVEELMVITLLEDAEQENVPLMVVVVEEGKVTVLGLLIVKLLKVLAPVKITAPDPLAVIDKL